MSELPRAQDAASGMPQMRLLQRPRSTERRGSQLAPPPMPSVIALDAMGSDRRPKPEIEGAIQAARHYDVHVLLVGPEPALRAELARYPAAAALPIDVVHASEIISMEDKAVQA